MIAINRETEVIIEDGHARIVVNPDGGGYIHMNGQFREVELHAPVYLIAARESGMDIPDKTIASCAKRLNEEYFG